jgi:hydroxymethylpyrimidine pyrophosphatase-like HAD family hydrolase
MKNEITNEIEYMVARAQAETDMARHVLEEARDESDYWKEKAAAKLLVFQESEEKMLTLYAELKLYHPELAEAVEARKPHLLELLAEAKQRFDAQNM